MKFVLVILSIVFIILILFILAYVQEKEIITKSVNDMIPVNSYLPRDFNSSDLNVEELGSFESGRLSTHKIYKDIGTIINYKILKFQDIDFARGFYDLDKELASGGYPDLTAYKQEGNLIEFYLFNFPKVAKCHSITFTYLALSKTFVKKTEDTCIDRNIIFVVETYSSFNEPYINDEKMLNDTKHLTRDGLEILFQKIND